MGYGRGLFRILVGNLRERDHLGDPVLDGSLIFIWMFWKWNVQLYSVSSWLRIGTSGWLL